MKEDYQRIERGSIRQYSESLQSDPRFPQEWIRANLTAIETENYSTVSELFREGEFVGLRGHFAIFGPYVVSRDSERLEKLSGVVGRVIPMPDLTTVRKEIQAMFGYLGERLPPTISAHVTKSWGNLKSETGEAFIVPDNWLWRESAAGPAINNMTEQRRRLKKAFTCISRIFDSNSAELLTRGLANVESGTKTQHAEYQLHDFGHESGLGLRFKLDEGLLPGILHKGVEEARADGVGLELAVRTQPLKVAAQIIASNLVTRFGLDAHRRGGVENDFDTFVAFHTAEHLFLCDALTIKQDKLTFRDPTPAGLIKATKSLREEAVDLTNDELRLSRPTDLVQLYEARTMSKTIRAIFQDHVVEPCRGIFKELR